MSLESLRRRTRGVLILALLMSALAPAPARAVIHEGNVAPDFHKTDLQGNPHTLYEYRGKVVVLFLLGYSCPPCNSNGGSFEANIKQHYQASHPGQVVVLGPDLWNGTPAQLTQFGVNTGATYPLLLNAGAGAGDENLYLPYGEQDNFAVINRQGIVRYHAYDHWPHNNRYHIDEIRGCVDSLVTNLADVGDGVTAPGLSMSARPSPFSATTTIELANPTGLIGDGRISVLDPAGRRVATLWSGPVPPGTTRVSWDRRDASGSAVAAGVYLIRSEIGPIRLTRRVVVLP